MDSKFYSPPPYPPQNFGGGLSVIDVESTKEMSQNSREIWKVKTSIYFCFYGVRCMSSSGQFRGKRDIISPPPPPPPPPVVTGLLQYNTAHGHNFLWQWKIAPRPLLYLGRFILVEASGSRLLKTPYVRLILSIFS